MSSKKSKIVGVMVILLFSVSFLFFLYNPDKAWDILRLFTDTEYLIEYARQYEPYTVIVLLALQIFQIIVAVIPGEPIGIAYGSIYGIYWGSLIGIIGTTLGTVVPVLISKRYGRKAAERMIGEENMEKYDGVTDASGMKPFIILILLPVVPDDAISYIAGLSDIDTKRLIIGISLARSVGIIFLALFGESLVQSDWRMTAILTIATIVVSLLLIWKYGDIVDDEGGTYEE